MLITSDDNGIKSIHRHLLVASLTQWWTLSKRKMGFSFFLLSSAYSIICKLQTRQEEGIFWLTLSGFIQNKKNIAQTTFQMIFCPPPEYQNFIRGNKTFISPRHLSHYKKCASVLSDSDPEYFPLDILQQRCKIQPDINNRLIHCLFHMTSASIISSLSGDFWS